MKALLSIVVWACIHGLLVSASHYPKPDGLSTEFYQNIQEELLPIFLKVFHIIGTEETLPNSFYEVTDILIPKPHKDSTKKDIYRPISLMNMDAKISIKYWQKKVMNTSKIIHHDQVGFIPEIQG